MSKWLLTSTKTVGKGRGRGGGTGGTGGGGTGGTLAPTPTVAPAITGSTNYGSILTCSTGTWANSPTNYLYQWMRDGVDIVGQIQNIYTSLVTDVSHSIKCRVTASNSGGSGVADSNSLVIIDPVTLPSSSLNPQFDNSPVSGTAITSPIVGQVLYFNPGTWANSPVSYIGQFYVANVPYGDPQTWNATDPVPFQTVNNDQIGSVLRLGVKAVNSFGTTAEVFSTQTSAVAAINLNNSAPTFTRTSGSGVTPMTGNVTFKTNVFTGYNVLYQVFANATDAANGTVNRQCELMLEEGDLPSLSITAFNTRGIVTLGSSPWTPPAATEVGRLQVRAVDDLLLHESGYSPLFSPTNLAAGAAVDDNFDDNTKDTAKWGASQLFGNLTANGELAETSQKLMYFSNELAGFDAWPTQNAGSALDSRTMFSLNATGMTNIQSIRLMVGNATNHGVYIQIGGDGGIQLRGLASSTTPDLIDSAAITLANYNWYCLYFKSSDKTVHLQGANTANTPPNVGDWVDLLTPSDFSGFRNAYYDFVANPSCRAWIGMGQISDSPALPFGIDNFHSTIPGVL